MEPQPVVGISVSSRRDRLPAHRIEPSRGWVRLNLDELWEYRELCYFFVWRDIKVRYKQTALGAAWAVIQPLLTMLVFSVFFGRLAKIPSEGVAYPLFCYAALLPWFLFAHGITHASNSLVESAHLMKRVYFPRLLVPLAAVLSGIVDFVVSFAVFLGMILYYGVIPTPNMLWLPLFFLLTVATALGAGLWLSAMNAKFRDVRYAIPFLTQFCLFTTPIAYPSSLLSEPWRTLYGLNPMAGAVEGFRWALLGSSRMPWSMLAVSVPVACALLASGAVYFRRLERTFADVV